MSLYRKESDLILLGRITPLVHKKSDNEDKLEVEFLSGDEKITLIDEKVEAFFELDDGTVVNKECDSINGNAIVIADNKILNKSGEIKLKFKIRGGNNETMTKTILLMIDVETNRNKTKRALPKWSIVSQVKEKDFDNKLNVRNFGAKGDGVTDDTNAIQRCFNEVKENGIIYIPNGTYIVNGVKLFNKKEVTIEGDGGRSIIKLKNNSLSKYVLNIEDCPSFIFKAITIDGNKEGQKIENSGLVVMRSEFSRIQNCNIRFFKGSGVDLKGIMVNGVFKGSGAIPLVNNYIYKNNVHGLLIDSVSDIIISENNIAFNVGNGIKIIQGTNIGLGNISIVNNQILSNDIDGIEIENNTSRIILSGNHIRNNGRYGLRWVGGKQLFVVGNNFHINGRIKNGVPAVIIGYNSKGFFIGNTFSCTDFTPTQSVAIEMYSSKKIYLIGNDVEDNQYNGIYIDPDSECYCYGNDRIADTTNNALSNVYLDTDNTKGNTTPDKSSSTGNVFCGNLNGVTTIINGNLYKCKHLIYNVSLRCKISDNSIKDKCLIIKVNDEEIGSLKGKDFELNNTWIFKTFTFDASDSNTLKVRVETGDTKISGNACVEYVIISPKI